MTGTEIKEMADSIVEDTIPDTLFYTLLNTAKNRVEDTRAWEFLKKWDATKTASAGDTFETAKALPTDFRSDYKLIVGSTDEYFPILHEEKYAYKDSARRYYVDVASGNFFLTGKGTGIIHLLYLKTTDDIDSSNSPVWPSRFHPLLAFEVAVMYQGGIDYDDPNINMSTMNRLTAKTLWDAMVSWDTTLKMRGMNKSFSSPEADTTATPLGQM
jgi:hypothetical protein